MKVRILAMLLLSSLSAASLAKGEPGAFDRVVLESELTSKPVDLGFGGIKLLDVVAHPEVEAKYKELRRLGSVSVTVQKVEAHNSYETNRNRYVFTSYARVGMLGSRKVAQLTVETYRNKMVMDHAPTEYDVGEIEGFSHTSS